MSQEDYNPEKVSQKLSSANEFDFTSSERTLLERGEDSDERSGVVEGEHLSDGQVSDNMGEYSEKHANTTTSIVPSGFDDASSVDKDIERFIRNERASRIRMALSFTFGILFFVGVGYFVFSMSDQFLELPIDIEEGEREVLAATNDPQCRLFIEDVENIGRDYRSYVPKMKGMLNQSDSVELQAVVDQLGVFRQRLVKQSEAFKRANLRFDESEDELNQWFRYIDNELSILQDLALWQIEKNQKINAKEKESASSEKVVDIVLKPKKETMVGAARINASKKKPEELYAGATLASQEAFESFRVWHTGGLHPCGAADDGETPWQADSSETTEVAHERPQS